MRTDPFTPQKPHLPPLDQATGETRKIAIDNFPHEIIEFPAIILDLEPHKDERSLSNSLSSLSLKEKAKEKESSSSDLDNTLTQNTQNHKQSTCSPTSVNSVNSNSPNSNSNPPNQYPRVIAMFHSYVRPTQFPILTDYCTHLTKITQEQVNNAPTFDIVLKSFNQFLNYFGLNPTDGRVSNVKHFQNQTSPYKEPNSNDDDHESIFASLFDKNKVFDVEGVRRLVYGDSVGNSSGNVRLGVGIFPYPMVQFFGDILSISLNLPLHRQRSNREKQYPKRLGQSSQS